MKRTLCFLLSLATTGLLARESVNFVSQPLAAGRASLSGDGYILSRTLGEAAFSPELRLPVQLVYDSSSDKSGLFGYGWRSPQLESSAVPERNAVVWVTPWGEKIQFTAKSAIDKKSLFSFFASKIKGRGYFTPYGDWEADTPAGGDAAASSGDWIFTGKLKYEGWKFTYRKARLAAVSAPSGRSLDFSYTDGGRLASVAQDGRAQVALTYTDKHVTGLTLNGVSNTLAYAAVKVQIPPKNPKAELAAVTFDSLASVRTGMLNPVTYAYDDHGYLVAVRQGDASETLEVRHETLAERRAKVKDALDKKVATPSGKLAGTLVSDGQFTYKRPYKGGVELTDKAGRTAFYNYDTQTGIFKTTDFSGKSRTVYYFMRYDVAYLGKVRQIADAKGRVVASYRYDKKTGNVTRVRDRAENDVEYAYTADGDLALVTRRAAARDVAEPLVRIEYDAKRNPAALMRLDAQGNAVVTTRLRSNAAGQPVSVSDGRTSLDITYTRQGYPETIRDAFGRVTRIAYDAYNRRVETVDPTGAKTRATYNGNGLVAAIERTFQGRRMISIAVDYDGNGRPVAYTDQRGRVKRLERDSLGRVVKELFPDGTGVGYGFDPAGQVAKVLDQNGHSLAFEWGRFGIESKETAAGQLTDYVYDADGRLARIDSRFPDAKAADRSIALAYDGLDRLISVNYGNGQIETMAYDSWGRVTEASSCGSKATLKYDYFGRLVEKREGSLTETYAYNAWNQRTERVTKTGEGTLAESRIYDRYGRLSQIKTDKGLVQYAYNGKNQLVLQTVNGTPVEYAYTPEGWLAGKVLGGSLNPVSTLKYFYAPEGQVTGRSVDGKVQQYRYDAKGQLTAVLDADNKPVETYAYDPAGNILKKTVNGETTTYVYDKANQLVSSEEDGILTTRYRYDAAGRLVEEGGKSYRYGWLDKVVDVSKNGKVTATFGYHAGGQIAKAEYGDKTESFLWDGLALIRRDGTDYVNEPHAGGGAPVLAGDKVLFNDRLGSTLGIKSADGFNAVQRTAFGEIGGKSMDEFFTGKPMVGDLGYAFLFRNYRPGLGKWQTADPLGYPDGWNNLAYVNNGVTSAIDLFGAVTISSFKDALDHYAWGGGVDATIASSVILQSTSTAGYAEQLLAVEALLAAQPFDVNSGHLSYSGDFFWDQGLILGGNTMNFYTSFDWTASSWAWDPYTGRFYRTLTGIGDILLYTEDDWDFEWHENASVWWNLVHEWGPSVAADFYSFFWGNPGQTGDAFHLSGAALIQDHMFWATQYKYE